MIWWHLVLSVIIGYFFGCISTGTLLAKAKGKDIKSVGSKNPGATNVYRTLGPAYGVMTLVGDILKVVLPCLLVRYIFRDTINSDALLTQIYSLYASLGASLGHNFPVFEHFKGGKGVSCMAAAVLMYDWRIFVSGLTCFIIIVAITKYVSVASLCAGVYVFAFIQILAVQITPHSILIGLFFVVSTTYLHIPNIKRLINHTERKFKLNPFKKEEKPSEEKPSEEKPSEEKSSENIVTTEK